jgi:hypothetical protein
LSSLEGGDKKGDDYFWERGECAWEMVRRLVGVEAGEWAEWLVRYAGIRSYIALWASIRF